MARDAGDVHVRGKYAFVAQGEWIRVYDISSPSTIIEVGESMTPGYTRAIWASESGAYVACYQAGLMVYELSVTAGANECNSQGHRSEL